MRSAYLQGQDGGLATTTCPPNIKKLDYPPTKKAKVASGSASAPVPVPVEPLTGSEGNPPKPVPLGRRAYMPRTREKLLQKLAQQVSTGRVPTSHDVLTWMDYENDDGDGDFIESWDEFVDLRIFDALDIMESELCYLGTVGKLGRGATIRLQQFTRDNVLVPLGLWATKPGSISSFEGLLNMDPVFEWRNGVEPGYVEDIEDVEEVKKDEVIEDVEEVKKEEAEVEVVEEEEDGNSSGIEEIEGWSDITLREWNYGQWEEEI